MIGNDVYRGKSSAAITNPLSRQNHRRQKRPFHFIARDVNLLAQDGARDGARCYVRVHCSQCSGLQGRRWRADINDFELNLMILMLLSAARGTQIAIKPLSNSYGSPFYFPLNFPSI